MNQSTSSSKTHKQKKCCEASVPPEITKVESRQKKKKQQQSSRNPFQDLSNKGSTDGVDDSTPSTISSMSSTEAPKGCLRFFLSHSSSSSSSSSSVKTPRTYLGFVKARTFTSETPKSAPNVRPARENSTQERVLQKPIHQTLEKSKSNSPPCMYQWHSGKKFTSTNASKSKLSSVLGSGSSRGGKLKLGVGESKQVVVDGVSDSDRTNLTPLSKVAGRSALNPAIDGGPLAQHGGEISNTDTNTNTASNNTKTPPVQASVSPEIQCGSTLVSTTTETSTPACYAAGHVLSGITEKRKCRSRGLLTVGEAKALGNFDNFDSDEDIDQDNAFGLANNCSISMLPLPTEASMCWLLEDGDQKEILESYYPQILEECNALNSPVPSPSRSSGPSLYLRNSISKEEDRKSHSDIDGKNSPFSTSSVDNKNIVQTPQSDSSSERQVARSLLREIDHELHSVAEHLRMASLSPWSYASIWDPRNSIFQFECFPSPSNSGNLSQFQKVLDDRGSWLSNSTLEDVSQSQTRISWREGLLSQIFEMDKIDCCTCLSDEEDDATCYKTNPLKPAQSLELDVNMKSDQIPSSSTEFLIHRNAQEEIPSQEPESISIDGVGLAHSDESGWALCYKNQLFKV